MSSKIKHQPFKKPAPKVISTTTVRLYDNGSVDVEGFIKDHHAALYPLLQAVEIVSKYLFQQAGDQAHAMLRETYLQQQAAEAAEPNPAPPGPALVGGGNGDGKKK